MSFPPSNQATFEFDAAGGDAARGIDPESAEANGGNTFNVSPAKHVPVDQGRPSL